MNPKNPSGVEAPARAETGHRTALDTAGLDHQYAELIELIWSCERQWAIDDRIGAAIKYGRPS